MEERQLLNFIAQAHKHTYAAPAEIRKLYRCTVPILEGHKEYDYSVGDFRYHDAYAGSYRAPWREIVFFQETPIWCMAYQGQHNPNHDESFFQEQAFPFLRRALMQTDDAMPFRGPSRYEEGYFIYTFEMQGDYRYFTGKEKIIYQGEVVFSQDIMGSIIQ